MEPKPVRIIPKLDSRGRVCGAIVVLSKKRKLIVNSPNNEQVELEVKVWAITPSALLVETETSSKTWLPKSVITDYGPPSDEMDYKTDRIFVPRWVAVDKGLI